MLDTCLWNAEGQTSDLPPGLSFLCAATCVCVLHVEGAWVAVTTCSRPNFSFFFVFFLRTKTLHRTLQGSRLNWVGLDGGVGMRQLSSVSLIF